MRLVYHPLHCTGQSGRSVYITRCSLPGGTTDEERESPVLVRAGRRFSRGALMPPKVPGKLRVPFYIPAALGLGVADLSTAF